MVDYCYFIRGCTIAYAESVAAVAQNMQEVKPHVFVSVPRVYEKVLSKVQETVGGRVADQAEDLRLGGGGRPRVAPLPPEAPEPAGPPGAEARPRRQAGLLEDQARGWAAGSTSPSRAARRSSRDLAEFFWGAGIPIYEGYGLSETSPVITVNTRDAVKMGTVGKPVPGVDGARSPRTARSSSKGPNIMKGYWNMQKETAEAIDAEGWFHTGDIGEVDAEGFLRITDRKKELIINAYGKNVAPAPIENSLKGSRFIGQAVVIGDRRKFLSALLVPDFEALKPWAEKQGIHAASRRAARGRSPGEGADRPRGGGGQRPPRRLREDRGLGAAAERVHPGDGRDHADAEGEAPGDQPEVRGRSSTASTPRRTSTGGSACASIFHLEVGADRLATLTFDSPDRKVNVFTRAAFQELERVDRRARRRARTSAA